MRIFQIVNGFCWWDATATVHSIEEAAEMFAPDCVFVEAPDFVHEGWGYDETAEGDARFLRPETPEGYTYDESSGTFAPEDTKSDAEQLADSIAAMKAVLAEAEARLAAMKGDDK